MMTVRWHEHPICSLERGSEACPNLGEASLSLISEQIHSPVKDRILNFVQEPSADALLSSC